MIIELSTAQNFVLYCAGVLLIVLAIGLSILIAGSVCDFFRREKSSDESIADIVEDLRRRASKHCGKMVGIYNSIADRIEAAAKRESEVV